MKVDKNFLLLSVFVAIIVVMVAKDLATAVLILVGIANFLVIYKSINKLSNDRPSSDKFIQHNDAAPETADNEQKEPELAERGGFAEPELTPYGDNYDTYRMYNDDIIAMYASGLNQSMYSGSIDQRAIDLAKSRNRDKSSVDAALSKGTEYFKYHFGEEFAAAEARPWWGREEY